MKIAVTGGKGGTGKSLVATSLAVEFAKNNKTVLLDADVECPNDHLLLSVKRKQFTKIYQPIPKWDFDKCTKCGKCASVCKQNAIVFVEDKYPAFVKDVTLDGHLDQPELFEKLKERFNEAQIVEIISVMGLFNYINRFNNTLGVLPE